MSTLQIDSTTLPAKRGYARPGRKLIGAWYSPGVGWRIWFARAAQVRVRAYAIDEVVLMPMNGILTIRPETKPGLVPFVFGDPSDFEGGGATGIDPCGIPGTLADHDRVIQRNALALYDIETGKPLVGGYKTLDRATNPAVKPHNGEHLVRAYTKGILHKDDPFVRQDLLMLADDGMRFWKTRGEIVLAGPAHVGDGYVGRSWSWTAYPLALLADSRASFMASVARHAIDPHTGSPQRLKKGKFWGSPSPWGPSKNPDGSDAGGSDVPDNIDVLQDFEAYHQISVFVALGMVDEAWKLARTVLARPLKKWIDCDTGLGVGSRAADCFQAWAALGTIAHLDRATAISWAKNWPVPRHKDFGGSVGPFANLADTRLALQDWKDPGKSRWFLDATA